MSRWTRLRNALLPGQMNRELDAEVRSHLDELEENGGDRRAFGNSLRYREQSREIKTWVWLDALRADVTFGWRQLMKKKTVTGAAILSLALGMGATTSVFRLVEAGFLRPLDIREAERLHFLRYTAPAADGKQQDRDSFSHQEMLAMREALGADAVVMMVSFADRLELDYGDETQPEKVSRQYVSGRMFDDFGLRPEKGRLFSAAEDEPGADHRVAVIGSQYWERRFGRDPAAVGKSLALAGERFRIIGVMQPSFTGTSTGAFTDIYLPLMANRQAIFGPQARQWSWARVLVHLRPGVTPEATQEKLRATFKSYREEVAKSFPAGAPAAFVQAYRNARLSLLTASRGISNFHRDYSMPLAILAGTALLVLLLSCASVANLLMAQSAARAKEMALRLSIGAGRGRLVQMLLIEGLLVAGMAGVLGLAFSVAATPLMVANLNPPDNPVRLMLEFDGRLMGMTALLTGAVTLLFALLPAFQASGLSPMLAMRGSVQAGARWGVMRSLVAVQFAFCFLVCFVAGLTVMSLRNLNQQPLGFAPERLLLVEVDHRSEQGVAETWQRLPQRAKELSGVQEAAVTLWPVQTGSAQIGQVQVGNHPVDFRGPYIQAVAPGWFRTMGIGLREGRDFHARDAEGMLVVNEQFGRHYFGRSALGERVVVEGMPHQVIGVVGDIRTRDVREEIRPTVYIPLPPTRSGTLTLRLNGLRPEAEQIQSLRQWIRDEFPQLRVGNVRTQMELIRIQTVRDRLLAALSSFFGVAALMLAGMGLYAVFAYTVSQRQKEIAIRMALGARVRSVAGAVVKESALALVLGAVTGLGVGLGAQKLIRAVLFEASGADPGVWGWTAMAVLTAAVAAAAAPVARAIRLDPGKVLRAE